MEPFAASGIRSIRFAREVPNVDRVVCNDLSVDAFKSLNLNIDHNGLKHVIQAENKNASEILNKVRYQEDKFDVIELDPYGSVGPYIEGSVNSLKNNGLLCVTSTDMKALSGLFPSTCWSRYQSVPIPKFAHREQALRILLQFISATAARHGMRMKPIMSINFDFYARVFVVLEKGKEKANDSVRNHIMVHKCEKCSYYKCLPLIKECKNDKGNTYHHPNNNLHESCRNCTSPHLLGGPFWGGGLHDVNCVEKIIKQITQESSIYKTKEYMLQLLESISDESSHPFYYSNEHLLGRKNRRSVKINKLSEKLLKHGYEVSHFHNVPKSVKTNASIFQISDLIDEIITEEQNSKEKSKSRLESSKHRKRLKLPRGWKSEKKANFFLPDKW